MLFTANYTSNLYTENKVVKNAILDFDTNVIKRVDINAFYKLKVLNNKILSLISELNFEKIFISYISSGSIFYRFKLIDSVYEFKWEIFTDEDGDCDFDSILHIYKNDVNTESTFGMIDYTFKIISDILFGNESYNTDNFFFFQENIPETYTLEYA